MLVLTRKNREKLNIGNAVVTIIKATNGTVKIGIEAPKEVKIMRAELLRKDAA